jgi:hypothetical protein
LRQEFFDGLGRKADAKFQFFTMEQWQKMENAGAIFLPAAGRRCGTHPHMQQFAGHYWTTSTRNCGVAWACYCGFCYDYYRSKDTFLNRHNRSEGRSVRLVKDYIPEN